MNTAATGLPTALLTQLIDALQAAAHDEGVVIGAPSADRAGDATAAMAALLVSGATGRPPLVIDAAPAWGCASADVLLILGGCSHVPWSWLFGLKPGGRAVFPLLGGEGCALYWWVQRPAAGTHWPARPITLADSLPWSEHWDASEAALIDALAHQLLDVQSLAPATLDGPDTVLVDGAGGFSRRSPLAGPTP